MSENTPMEDLKEGAAQKGTDTKTRRLLIILVILWLVTVGALVAFLFNAYQDEREKTLTLAEQISEACERDGLESSGLSKDDQKVLCSNADKVIEAEGEIQDTELQQNEIQDPEIQDAENQDPEIQDRENQNQELQAAESQEAEVQDPENQDDEIQDPEEQEPENQEPENQDPEVDDPDPNDQIQGGNCEFTGQGTITITIQTNNGPVSFSCTGSNAGP